MTKSKQGMSVIGSAPVTVESPCSPLSETPAFQLDYDNDVAFHLAQNLIRLRRFRKMTQEQAAKEVGTSQPAIARIESGEGNTTVNTLHRLIIALRGRFQVSIAPEELPIERIPLWWERGDRAHSTTERTFAVSSVCGTSRTLITTADAY